MKHVYYIPYTYEMPGGRLGFSFVEYTSDLPIINLSQLADVAEALKQKHGHAGVVISGFTLMRIIHPADLAEATLPFRSLIVELEAKANAQGTMLGEVKEQLAALQQTKLNTNQRARVKNLLKFLG